MSYSKLITVLGLVLGVAAPAAFGAPLVADTDAPTADGVPNNVEYWMQRVGATVDDVGAPILAWTTNDFSTDTDGDGIPDLVEIYFTLTDPTVDDRVPCTGSGTPNMTGQYEIRRAANLGAAVNLLTDELLAISVCQTGSTVKVFEPRMGYATSADFASSTLNATWSYRGLTVTFSGSCSSCSVANVVLTGSLSIAGNSLPASATRRAASGASGAAVSGLYAVQEAHYPHQPGASADKLQDLGSRALQIDVLSNSQARVYTKDTYEAYPAYYSALTGTVFYTSFLYWADTYKEYDSLNSWDDSRRIALMVTQAPVAGAGGGIRGSGTQLYSYPGSPMAVTEKQLYGKAKPPITGGVTLNRTVGVGSFLYLNNVPVSADSATVSGSGLSTSTIWNDLDNTDSDSTTQFNDRAFSVNYRFRIPGFTDGVKVGLATDGTSLNVSNIRYDHTGKLASGNYAFNFTGAVGGWSAVNVTHTDRSSTPLPVVSSVALDGTPLLGGRHNGLAGVDMTIDHTLSWMPVTTGGINNNGVGTAGEYRVIITDAFTNRVFAPPPAVTITDVSPDSLNFVVNPAVSCPGTCSVVIKAGTLDQYGNYRIVIEARDQTNADNRSQTDRYYVNTPPYIEGDFNADSTADIVWRNAATGLNLLWYMDYTGLAPASTDVIGGDLNWTALPFAQDFDDDGVSDMLWRQSSGPTVMSLMARYGGIRELRAIGGDSNWSVVGVGDFNGDGYADLLWRNESTGVTLMWLMRKFEVASETVLGGDSNWSVVQTGDFNGDGKSDIVWRNGTNGQVLMWLMNGAAVSNAQLVGGDLNWLPVASGDLNGDGKRDLLWRYGGVTFVSYMNGATMTSVEALGGDTNWQVVRVHDYNGDGKSDIVWRNNTNGLSLIWLMDGSTVTDSQVLGGDLNWRVN